MNTDTAMKEGKAYLKKVENRLSRDARRQERVLSTCRLCLANGMLKEEEILSISDHFYLLQPRESSFVIISAPFPGKHFLLVPFSHTKSIREINEQEVKELRQYKSALEQFAESQDEEILYLETAYRYHTAPHAKLEVLFAPKGSLEQVSIFYTKSFSDMDGDWATHKKVIEISKKEGGLFRQIPMSRLIIIQTFLTFSQSG